MMNDITRPKYSAREFVIISDMLINITPDVAAPTGRASRINVSNVGAIANAHNVTDEASPKISSSGHANRPLISPASGMLINTDEIPNGRKTMNASCADRPNSRSMIPGVSAFTENPQTTITIQYSHNSRRRRFERK